MKTGDVIMDESGALADVGERVDRHPSWMCGGWMITRRNTGNAPPHGHPEFLADSMAFRWRRAPLGWAPHGTVWERWILSERGVWRRQATPPAPCPECDGMGWYGLGDPCPTCLGRGNVPLAEFSDPAIVQHHSSRPHVETINTGKDGPL